MNEQEKRENVIKGLECIRDWAQFTVNHGWIVGGASEKMVKYAEDALALLKAQEARVMTLEEIAERQEVTCWLEWRDGDSFAAILYANDLKVDYMKFCTSCAFMKSEYGKTVRCWTSHPTDEQREATPWN